MENTIEILNHVDSEGHRVCLVKDEDCRSSRSPSSLSRGLVEMGSNKKTTNIAKRLRKMEKKLDDLEKANQTLIKMNIDLRKSNRILVQMNRNLVQMNRNLVQMNHNLAETNRNLDKRITRLEVEILQRLRNFPTSRSMILKRMKNSPGENLAVSNYVSKFSKTF